MSLFPISFSTKFPHPNEYLGATNGVDTGPNGLPESLKSVSPSDHTDDETPDVSLCSVPKAFGDDLRLPYPLEHILYVTSPNDQERVLISEKS